MKTSIKKSLKALLKGYMLFRVRANKQTTYHLLYHFARDERLKHKNHVEFEGFHIVYGWETLFARLPNTIDKDKCPF